MQQNEHRHLGGHRRRQDQALWLPGVLSRSGLGGHCIPLDPYYLSWKAREYGFHTSMIEASMMVNDRMPEYTVERAGKILNRHKKALNGAKVPMLGMAYKQDIDDYRKALPSG